MILVDISKCTGCRRCETVCSFFRSGRINNRLSRIKVVNIYETGVDGPVVCQQCKERYCTCCPEQALSVGSLGQIVHSPTLCKLCGTCEKACPVGAVEIFSGFVYVCDLCGGRLRCVEACTEGAITYLKDIDEEPSLAEYRKGTKRMNPSEKRAHYIKKRGSELREKWSKRHA